MMTEPMKIFSRLRQTILLPLSAALFLLAGCGQLAFTAGSLLNDVAFSNAAITPNADGADDVTEIRYSLRRPADVSIFFEDAAGERYYFRDARRRAAGDYTVLWGGVVDEPLAKETDYGPISVLSWVLPDGQYRWTVEAVEEGAEPVAVSGEIVIEGGDTMLPELQNFVVTPEIFRPNQDGLADDRVRIAYYLSKDVDSLLLYLEDPADAANRYYISESPGLVLPTERGYHDYSYDGGIDLNAEPPADGDYWLVGEVRDAAGNTVRVERPLRIEEGGKPRADVVGGEIDWQGESNRTVLLTIGQSLCFTAVVANESLVPIRTSGPWPGQHYVFGENSNTLALREDESWLQQDGVWRFGINFDTTGVDFPYRWAVGRKEDLEMRLIDGREQWYLMPGQRGQVSGCIQLEEKLPTGTRYWWGGLIQQGVEVVNNNIDQITVQLGTP
jgi:hypothetical protein